jgi:hypothetical protein
LNLRKQLVDGLSVRKIVALDSRVEESDRDAVLVKECGSFCDLLEDAEERQTRGHDQPRLMSTLWTRAVDLQLELDDPLSLLLKRHRSTNGGGGGQPGSVRERCVCLCLRKKEEDSRVVDEDPKVKQGELGEVVGDLLGDLPGIANFLDRARLGDPLSELLGRPKGVERRDVLILDALLEDADDRLRVRHPATLRRGASVLLRRLLPVLLPLRLTVLLALWLPVRGLRLAIRRLLLTVRLLAV